MNANSSDREDVRALVRYINDTWLKNPPEKIPDLLNGAFSDEIVVYGPDWKELARGRKACVNSYANFARQGKIHECRLSDPRIDISGDTAVATYAWDMWYGMNGQDYRESGHDVFVFTRNRGRWQAVWRLLVTSPPQGRRPSA